MKDGRILGLSISLLLAAGCGGGGGGGTGSASPGLPAVVTPTPAPSVPPTSSAATYLVANVSTAQPSVPYGPTDPDDGGWSELNLPVLVSCGNGTFATDCSVWSFDLRTGSGSARSPRAARAPRTALVGSQPPTLNFCRDAASYPSSLGVPALEIQGPSAQSFALGYSGTKQLPIVTFATRPWAAGVSATFSGSSTYQPAITVTPAAIDTASRGWLLFFTWSWPADVLVIPYQLNEIQPTAASSPLTIPAGGSARLSAFDCLGQPITATSALGSEFGFNSALTSSSVTSTGTTLSVPVYAGPKPSGQALLYDAVGSTVETTVN